MKVRYLGGRPLEVVGPVTGTTYRFSGRDRVQTVDPRDAAALVRSRWFRVEGMVEVSETRDGR